MKSTQHMVSDRPTKTKTKLLDKYRGGRRFDAFDDIPDLSMAQHGIMHFLGGKMHMARPDNSSWNLSYEELAKGARCSVRSAKYAMVGHKDCKGLIERGLVGCNSRYAEGHQARNEYSILPLAFSFSPDQSATIAPMKEDQSATIAPMKEDQSATIAPPECNQRPVMSATIAPVMDIGSNIESNIYIQDPPPDPAPTPPAEPKARPNLRSVLRTGSAGIAELVHRCFRTPGYYPSSDWGHEAMRLRETYPDHAFEVLERYMTEKNLRGLPGRIPVHIETYLKAAVVWEHSPDSPEAVVNITKRGEAVPTHQSHLMPKKPTKTTAEWIADFTTKSQVEALLRDYVRGYTDSLSPERAEALKAKYRELGFEPDSLKLSVYR